MILWMWRISWLIFIFTLIAIVSSWHLTDSRSLLTSPNSFWSCALWSLESSHNYNQINKYCHDPSPSQSSQLQSILTNIKSPNPTSFFRNLETQDSRLESRILTQSSSVLVSLQQWPSTWARSNLFIIRMMPIVELLQLLLLLWSLLLWLLLWLNTWNFVLVWHKRRILQLLEQFVCVRREWLDR